MQSDRSLVFSRGLILASVLVSAGITGCSHGGGSGSGGSQGATGHGSTPGSGAGASGAADIAATSNGTAATQTAAWCAAAAKTQIVKSQGLQQLFSALCVDGAPTSLFTQALVDAAYAGSGTPSLQTLQPLTTSGNTVTAAFGFGIKMPGNAESYFAQVSPLAGQVGWQTAKTAAEGGIPGNVTVQSTAASADAGWVRGWLVETPSTTKTGLFSINTDYAYETNQYQLETGLYMETSTLQHAVSTIQDYEILTAMFDIGGTGYQLTTAKVAANDYGVAGEVGQALTQVVDSLVAFTYTQSK